MITPECLRVMLPASDDDACTMPSAARDWRIGRAAARFAALVFGGARDYFDDDAYISMRSANFASSLLDTYYYTRSFI